jgi:hypothetical protein
MRITTRKSNGDEQRLQSSKRVTETKGKSHASDRRERNRKRELEEEGIDSIISAVVSFSIDKEIVFFLH